MSPAIKTQVMLACYHQGMNVVVKLPRVSLRYAGTAASLPTTYLGVLCCELFLRVTQGTNDVGNSQKGYLGLS